MQIKKYQSCRWSWTLVAVAGLTLLAAGSQIKNISDIPDIVATLLFIGGSALAMVGLVYTLPATNALEIAEEGFSYRAGWRRIFCRWEQCSEFSRQEQSLFGLTASELVIFSSDTPANSQKIVLPCTFGLSADELVQKMNHFRQMQLERLQKPAQTFL